MDEFTFIRFPKGITDKEIEIFHLGCLQHFGYRGDAGYIMGKEIGVYLRSEDALIIKLRIDIYV